MYVCLPVCRSLALAVLGDDQEVWAELVVCCWTHG